MQKIAMFKINNRAFRVTMTQFLMGVMISVLVTCSTLALSYLVPNSYTSYVVALPPKEKKAAGSLAKVFDIAALSGTGMGAGDASSLDEILAILDSRTIKALVCTEFSLINYYNKKNIDEAIRSFTKDYFVQYDRKSNRITFGCLNKNPKTATLIASRVAILLQDRFNEIRQASSRREREFLERRMALASLDLKRAESEFAAYQKETGIIEIESQTKATIETIGKLQEQLVVYQIELKSVSEVGMGNENPAIISIKIKIKELSRAIEKVGLKTGENSIFINPQKLPDLAIRYLELMKEFKKSEILSVTLAAQLETARISEVRDLEVLTIIDPAFVPDQKSGPKRSIIAGIAGLLTAAAMAISFIATAKDDKPNE